MPSLNDSYTDTIVPAESSHLHHYCSGIFPLSVVELGRIDVSVVGIYSNFNIAILTAVTEIEVRLIAAPKRHTKY